MRVVSVFGVLFIHSGTHGATLFLHTDSAAEYALSLFLSMFVRFAVPVFFMISGALLLGRNEPLRVVLTRRVLRIAVVSLITFAVYYLMLGVHMGTLSLRAGAVFDFLRSIWTSPLVAPLWYLYAYLAAMLMLPFLRPLAQGMRTRDFVYLLVLHILLVCVAPILGTFVFHAPLSTFFSIPFATVSCIFYMLLGYAAEHRIPQSFYTVRHTAILFAIMAAACAIGGVLTWYICRRDGATHAVAGTVLGIMAVFPSMAVYCGARTFFLRRAVSAKAQIILSAAAQNVFGIYLIEKLVRELLIGIFLRLRPILTTLPACFVWMIACFVCGQIVIWLLRRIPFVRKLIG